MFEELLSAVAWRAERRRMYDRVLDAPRLVSFCDLTAEPAPHPAVSRLRRRLNDIYAGELGEPFTSAGFCLYRDGSDSVAWHGDTIGRSSTEDTRHGRCRRPALPACSPCGRAAGPSCAFRSPTATCW